MEGTQLFVSLVMAGVVDLRHRRPVTHMSLGAYLGSGGPIGRASSELHVRHLLTKLVTR